MSDQCQPYITHTVTPVAEIAERRFVNWAHAQAGADEDCMGISAEKIEAGCPGLVVMGVTAVIEAGAPIDGSTRQLKSGDGGRAVPCTTGDAVQAVLKEGQTAVVAGAPIEVYPTNHISAVA